MPLSRPQLDRIERMKIDKLSHNQSVVRLPRNPHEAEKRTRAGRSTTDQAQLSNELDEPTSSRVASVIGGLQESSTPEETTAEALVSKRPVHFTNSRGDSFDLALRKGKTDGDLTSYKMTLDGQSVDVKLGSQYKHPKVLGDLADYYSEIPEHLRPGLQEVELKSGNFRRHKHYDGFVPSNTGHVHLDQGAVKGDGSLSRSLFHHEFGHVLGNHLENQEDGKLENFVEGAVGEIGPSRPKAFKGAYKSEGSPNLPGNSAGSNALNEEFADGWQTYLDARLDGGEKLQKFTEKYPQLAGVYEEIYSTQSRSHQA